MTRREAVGTMAAAAAATWWAEGLRAAGEPQRPNILWLSCEDTGIEIGCYGDTYADTPTVDALAARGVRYTNAFAHAGVCAPARSGIITGCYPSSIGTRDMRCAGIPPRPVRCFPEYLRQAGYWCTNRSKTDYQLNPGAPLSAWDQCGNQAHWRGRAPGQPFFSVFNLTVSHESQIRNRSAAMQQRLAGLGSRRHDPARAVLPPYYPDTPRVREDWAQYYDVVTLMDDELAGILQQLEADGLAEETIVWFWGDHGRGLPRGKRWLYDSGVHVPLVIHVPEKYREWVAPRHPAALAPGSTNDELVAFVDFAPTVLSLAGVPLPDHFQGQAFLGPQRAAPREYVYGARDRMDETYDLIRTVRDKRYHYFRNYLADIPRSQHLNYMDQMPTMQELRRLYAAGETAGWNTQFMEPSKPLEELYDTQTDPHEINNLAGDPRYRDILARLRAEHLAWQARTGDTGLLPEPELDKLQRPAGLKLETALPGLASARPVDDGIEVSLVCHTPGSSIVWKLDGGWRVYAGPILVRANQTLEFRACRLGYRDSPQVQWRPGQPLPEAPAVAEPPQWRETLDQSDLLIRLSRLRQLDFAGTGAREQLLAATGEPEAALRYWAALGLGAAGRGDAGFAAAVRPTLLQLLDDPADLVRCGAARALASLGDRPTAVAALLRLTASRENKTRLHVLNCLWELRDEVREQLPLFQQLHRQEADAYAKRVAERFVRWLGGQITEPAGGEG